MKKTLLLLATLFLGLAATAKPVDKDAAARVATNFWNMHRDADVETITTMISLACPFDGLYIFVGEQKGFVVVAADDCVPPILGYSFTSPASESLNPEVRYWLSTYQRQIDALRNSNCEASAEVRMQWQQYNSSELDDTPPTPLTDVSPLLTTTWDQYPYYNDLCPFNETANERTVTGCVATATAQVMKYWNHPSRGNSSHTYVEDDFGVLNAFFGPTTYDWSHMPNALTSVSSTVQRNAVSTLMYHVGVAINMNYGIAAEGGSGAYLSDVGIALPAFFGYRSDNGFYLRDNYTDAQWTNYINTELNAQRPVIYGGSDTSGGHCFVCDGYNNANQYHFNWGWGGYYDGYYLLSNLAPGSGGTGTNVTNTFNLGQHILVGIQPDTSYTPHPFYLPNPNCLISSFPYTQSFNSSADYDCLRAINANSDTVTWGVVNSYGVEGSACAYIMYAVEADDYLVLPGITTPGYYTISWKAKAFDANYSETYVVYVGKEMVYAETLNSTSFVSRTASFSVAPGDTVVPFFQYISDDKYYFFLDDINIAQSTSPEPPTPCVVTEFPWTEGFEDVSTLDCWRSYDVDGDGYNWSLFGAEDSLWGHSGDYCITSASWASTPLTPDNWLVTPGIAIPAGQQYVLKWYVKGLDPNWASEHYSVYVSTTGNAPGDFTAAPIYTGNSTATWVQKSVNLNSYAGQTIYIAFRHHNVTDMFHIVIDDVEVSEYQPPVQYTITATSANPTMGSVSGGGTYNEGTTATLTATPNSGYHFVRWQDNNTQNPRTVTVSENATYTAYFEANAPTQYTLTVTSANPTMGSVSGGGTYNAGATATLTATPNSGYHFVRWQDSNTQNPRTVTVNANASYTAYFEANAASIDDIGNTKYNIEISGLTVTISNPDCETVELYDITGRRLASSQQSIFNYHLSNTGVYLVRVGNVPAHRVVVIGE